MALLGGEHARQRELQEQKTISEMVRNLCGQNAERWEEGKRWDQRGHGGRSCRTLYNNFVFYSD